MRHLFLIIGLTIAVLIPFKSLAHDTENITSDKGIEAFLKENFDHKILDQFAGHWNHVIKWRPQTGGDLQESRGETHTKWILGGRYLEREVSGDVNGEAFEGLGIIGFNTSKRVYETFWIDTFGSSFTRGEGEYSGSDKQLVEIGTFTDPVGNEKNYRGVYEFIDNDHYTYEMYVLDNRGFQLQVMMVEYERHKPAADE